MDAQVFTDYFDRHLSAEERTLISAKTPSLALALFQEIIDVNHTFNQIKRHILDLLLSNVDTGMLKVQFFYSELIKEIVKISKTNKPNPLNLRADAHIDCTLFNDSRSIMYFCFHGQVDKISSFGVNLNKRVDNMVENVLDNVLLEYGLNQSKEVISPIIENIYDYLAFAVYVGYFGNVDSLDSTIKEFQQQITPFSEQIHLNNTIQNSHDNQLNLKI